MAGNYIVSQTTDIQTGKPVYLVVGQNGVNANTVVFYGTNQSVANNLASLNVITAADVKTATIQDVNYAGGVQNTTFNIPAGLLFTTNDANGNPTARVISTTVDADTQKLIDAGLYDPGIGYNGQGVATSTTVPNSDTGFNFTTIDANAVPVGQITDISPLIDPASTLSPGETIVPASQVNTSAQPVTATAGTWGSGYDDDGNLLPGYQLNENNDPVYVGNQSTTTMFNPDGTVTTDLSEIQGKVKNAQQQQTIADQRKQINNGDWRVRLRLAPQATYLYNASDPGILAPLSTSRGTDGIVFPYTPQISTAYRAQYTTYDLTHSNYRGYFYQNSYVDAINLSAKFTAQDTNEANYLLAVIHFFRSVTKMFYGQDAERGSPPPVCYLSGFGDYQFKEAPCLVQQFNYTLPPDVDYIRAGSPNNVGLNLTSVRTRQDVATNSIFSTINRLANAFLPKGGITNQPSPPTLGLNRPTYVPTMMEMSLTLLPIQSRNQVSKEFSLKDFASGKLIQKGFW